MHGTVAMHETSSSIPIQLRSCSRMHRGSLMNVTKCSYAFESACNRLLMC